MQRPVSEFRLPDTGGAVVPPSQRIVVHIDSAETLLSRIQAARLLAQIVDAEIVACYSATPSAMRHGLSVGLALRSIEECEDEDNAQRAAAYDTFRDSCSDMDHVRWHSAQGDSQSQFVRQALYADYLVLQQMGRGKDRAGVPASFVDHVLVNTGKASWVLPRSGCSQEMPRTIAIAWNESREAAHAVSSAIPLLRQAAHVHLLGHGVDAQRDLAAMASRLSTLQRGCTQHRLEDVGAGLGQQLIRRTHELGADLLVMGCYGHGQASEKVLGGVTREVLDRMPCSVWMAH